MGQRWLTIHGTNINGTTPKLSVRKKVILFGISLSQRVRDIPNDRFGEIVYMEDLSMAAALEELIPRIESEDFFQRFRTALDKVKVLPIHLTNPENTAAGVPRYMLSDSFRFISLNLDPQHLYPSDFLTRSGNDKEQLYDKVAGYRMTLVFESAEYQETYPPLQCKPIYDNE